MPRHGGATPKLVDDDTAGSESGSQNCGIARRDEFVKMRCIAKKSGRATLALPLTHMAYSARLKRKRILIG